MKNEKLSSKERRRKKKKKRIIIKTVILLVLLVILGVGLWLVYNNMNSTEDKGIPEQTTGGDEIEPSATPTPTKEAQEKPVSSDAAAIMEEAELLAMQYDYDGAMQKLMEVPDYQENSQVVAKIAEYQSTKDSCVAVKPENVTHIFYHSLVVEPEKAFDQSVPGWEGFCQWMTTVDEFNAITQQMYDNGYVLVSLKDLVNETTDEDGTVHFTKGNILLPEGKKPFVLSLDDLSYYHSYDGRGIATKMIIGEDGKPTCEYIQEDGTTVTGAYDCIPLMDAFLEEHPDASYHGAKGTVALTGYNGILGYRTDIAYKTRQNLAEDQEAYLAANPDFDWDAEVAEAKKVAEAIKEDGWDFASHTWGHIRIGDATMENIKEDTEKWMSYVSPLIGGTDTIIFAHGQDLADWHDYSADNEKFSYFKSKGFNYFCNVDSAQYFLQIRDNYVRQGRRNLDGYRLWNDVHGEKNRTSDLFDAATVLDPKRTDVPDL